MRREIRDGYNMTYPAFHVCTDYSVKPFSGPVEYEYCTLSDNTGWFPAICCETGIFHITTDCESVPLRSVSASAEPSTISPGGATQLSANVCGEKQDDYTYSWAPPTGLTDPPNIANPEANPVETTTYKVTVTDGGGITVTDRVTVTVKMELEVTATPNSIFPDNSTQLNVIVTGGNGDYHYSWTAAHGPTHPANPTIPNPVVSPSRSETYRVLVTDGMGQTARGSVDVAVDTGLHVTATPNSILPGNSTQLNVTGNSGNYSYRWQSDPPNSGFLSEDDKNNQTLTVEPTVNTVYTATATHQISGEVVTDFVSVAVQMELVAVVDEDPIIGRSTWLEADVRGGTPPYTYHWIPSEYLSQPDTRQTEASPPISMLYTVSVSDSDGTMLSDDVAVSVMMNSEVTAMPLPNSSGKWQLNVIASGGNGTYTYSWENSTGGPAPANPNIADPVVSPPGREIYTVTVTDGFGQTVGGNVVVNGTPNLTYWINTFAGGGVGDNNDAIQASLGRPNGVAVDSVGNLYIADTDNHRIRKVDTNGIITTVAGNGIVGFSGDGGDATEARLTLPRGVAVDNQYNLYIADTDNHRIRKVDINGIITTVAGDGTRGFSGDGGDATKASLSQPSDVAVDSAGNLYIADQWNHRIRKVDYSDPNVGIITTVAGDGTGGFSGDGGDATKASLSQPSGVAVDSTGNLYIADTSNHRIRKIDYSDPNVGIITTVAGTGDDNFSGDGGNATLAGLYQPSGVAVDSDSNLYIADTDNLRIRKVDTYGTITTVAGNGNRGFSDDGGDATKASLNQPSGVTVDSAGNLFIADTYNHRIRKVEYNNPNVGIISTVAGTGDYNFSGDGRDATQAGLHNPKGVVLDSAGNLYIADTFNHRIRKVDTSGTITTVAGNGTEGFSGDGGDATQARLRWPYGVAVDSDDNLYIVDNGNNCIRKVDTNGIITTVAGNGTGGFSGDGGDATQARLNSPYGVAVDSDDNLYIVDNGNNCIRKVDTNGIITTVAGNGTRGFSGDGGDATQARLRWPYGVAVDNQGNLYIADRWNHRIRKVDYSDPNVGIITTVAGNGSSGFYGDGGDAIQAVLNFPSGVAVDASGNLYIADTSNHRIRKVDATSGIINTVAGNGTQNSSGDGGLSIEAGLGYPVDVVFDSNGNFFIADTSNSRIRYCFH